LSARAQTSQGVPIVLPITRDDDQLGVASKFGIERRGVDPLPAGALPVNRQPDWTLVGAATL